MTMFKLKVLPATKDFLQPLCGLIASALAKPGVLVDGNLDDLMAGKAVSVLLTYLNRQGQVSTAYFTCDGTRVTIDLADKYGNLQMFEEVLKDMGQSARVLQEV